MTQLKEKIRAVTFLSRNQIDFLDKLGKDALFMQGLKLSRSEILSEMVDLLIDLRMDIKKINLTQENLEKAILKMVGVHTQDKNEQKPIS